MSIEEKIERLKEAVKELNEVAIDLRDNHNADIIIKEASREPFVIYYNYLKSDAYPVEISKLTITKSLI